MTLFKFFAACILVCYSQSVLPKRHAKVGTFVANKKTLRAKHSQKTKTPTKVRAKKNSERNRKKKEQPAALSENVKISKDNKEKNDDTFLSHLNRLDIPEKYKLKEITIGNLSAKKTLIIYFSYTCPHCREFHMKEFPLFKQKYVDAGKIKIIFRNYIDDQGAYEAAQIIRCLCGDSADKYMQLSEIVLRKQPEWLRSDDPANFLVRIFTNNGMSEDSARACLKKTDVGAGLMLEQKRAMRDLQLISMPSFINEKGEKRIGATTCDELAKFCGLE